jgi:hypothetical protein
MLIIVDQDVRTRADKAAKFLGLTLGDVTQVSRMQRSN